MEKRELTNREMKALLHQLRFSYDRVYCDKDETGKYKVGITGSLVIYGKELATVDISCSGGKFCSVISENSDMIERALASLAQEEAYEKHKADVKDYNDSLENWKKLSWFNRLKYRKPQKPSDKGW